MEDGVVDKLLHIADLHFWQVVVNPFRLLSKRFIGNVNVLLRRRHEFAMERAEPFAQALEQTGIRTALFTGDFTSTSTTAEFIMARGFVDDVVKHGFTVHLMPGNHDIYTFEARRAQRFQQHFAPYVPEDGYPARVALPGGTPLVLLAMARPNILSARGAVTQDDIRRVKQHLDAIDAGPVVVSGHYPLLNKTAGYDLKPAGQLRNGEALRRALGASGKRILYVCGHVHRFSYENDPDYPTLSHLSTGAFFRKSARDGLAGEFSELHIAADGAFTVFRHTFRKEWLRAAIGLPEQKIPTGP